MQPTHRRANAATILALLLVACAVPQPSPFAELIFVGGDIVTVNDEDPTAEALAVAEGRILAVGPRDLVLRTRGPATRLVDLAGRTLLPGFIDSHSHIAPYVGSWGQPNLAPPPVGNVRSIDDLVAEMQRHLATGAVAAGAVVLGMGYDDSLLAERRHPRRDELDRISTTQPVLAIHASGHLVAANSKALALVGYDKNTVDPPGGLIRRGTDGDPDGVCEELAALPFMRLMSMRSLPEQLTVFDEVQRYYASQGITTAHDGISMPNDIALLQAAAQQGRLILDVVSYPRWDLFDDVLSGRRKLDIRYFPPNPHACDVPIGGAPTGGTPDISASTRTVVGRYQNRLKFAGVKITADGSPQGKTAFLTAPYVVPPPGQPADYRGYASITQDELDRWFEVAWRNDVQLNVHCNGDAAADMMLAAVRKAQQAHGKKDLRPVMIHAQMIRPDQVQTMAELGVVPSFFTAHTFYWGDWHRTETVGETRAAGMSPCALAVQKGMRFTNHTDAAVVPPSQIDAMWTAMQRQSRSGVVIGPDQRIGALDALKAVTIHAAYQYFEERSKGSLETGKRADLVILSANPLRVPPAELRNLRVLETIKDGRTIWSAP
jgi:predicted amidohydrolase YtcJ